MLQTFGIYPKLAAKPNRRNHPLPYQFVCTS
jgi:hypothetical protein